MSKDDIKWGTVIDLEEAVELSWMPEHAEYEREGRWYTSWTYVAKWEASPTGYVIFGLAKPKGENTGYSDINEKVVELHAAVKTIVETEQWTAA